MEWLILKKHKNVNSTFIGIVWKVQYLAELFRFIRGGINVAFSSGEQIDERGPGGEKLEQLPAEVPDEGDLGGFDPEEGGDIKDCTITINLYNILYFIKLYPP